MLWVSGFQSVYFDALRILGVNVFRVPFLDIHAVLAAAECHRQGIDVYLSNPCDVLGRLDGYSPLWLAITPGSWGVRETPWVGAILDLLFILALPIVIRPRSAGQAVIFAAAAFSPMTVFALERANIDIIIFLLIVCASALYVAPRSYRLCSYGVFLITGLLKFYPLVLLVLMARERWRNVLLPATIAAASLILFGLYYHADLSRALTNIPPVPYFTNGFSAINLPYGFAERMPAYPLMSHAVIAISVLSVVSAIAIAWTWHNVRFLATIKIDWAEREASFLAIGSLLLTACFFAAPNVDYRGIFFLLVLPGLVRLRQSADSAAIRKFLSWMIAATLFVMWKEFSRRSLHVLLASLPNEWLREFLEFLFWLGREFVWWWLITGLASIVILHLWRMPLTKDRVAGLHRLAAFSHDSFKAPPAKLASERRYSADV